MKFNRIFLIVLDSLGIGALPDAKQYGDSGANTFLNIAKKSGKMNIPTLEKMGIKNILPELKTTNLQSINTYTGRLAEKSLGKDTMTGHWEIVGLEVTEPFVTFTDTGFPSELICELENRTGRKVVGNKSASGLAIIEEYGEHQIATGDLIVYTSADSVLQIAAHEDHIGLDELYRCCAIAREITMDPKWKVGRVIARPFIGESKNDFKRTSNRKDYALKPFAKTVLSQLKEKNLDVIALGKINDIYDGEGITSYEKTVSNEDGMNKLAKYVNEVDFCGVCMLNLVDFDMLYGHRRDVVGYKKAIEEFDKQFKEILPNFKNDDLVILTADHGNDPTAKGSDHTREFVPFICYSPLFKSSAKLDDGTTFANIGATIADNFELEKPQIGVSVLDELN